MRSAETMLGVSDEHIDEMQSNVNHLGRQNDIIVLTRVRQAIDKRLAEIRLLLRDGHLKNVPPSPRGGKRRGYPKPKLTHEDGVRIHALRGEGLSYRKIGPLLGVSHDTARRFHMGLGCYPKDTK